MKKALIGLLLVGSFAMAATKGVTVKTRTHLSRANREALSTQSPRIKFSRRDRQTLRPGYRVVTAKGTINAFVPYGK